MIGFDLDKDESIVWPAYNDRRGVSAAFNLNLLARINRELGADFDLDAFAHRADYVRAKERVEMHLVSQKDAGRPDRPGRNSPSTRARRSTPNTRTNTRSSISRRLTARAGFTLDAAVDRSERDISAVQYLIVD